MCYKLNFNGVIHGVRMRCIEPEGYIPMLYLQDFSYIHISYDKTIKSETHTRELE